MMWKTHAIGGLQAGVIVMAATNTPSEKALLVWGAAAIGSLIPDIDHPDSKISRFDVLLSLVSEGLSKVVKHRRETHTVWAAILCSLVVALLMMPALISSEITTTYITALGIAIGLDIFGLKIGSFAGILFFIYCTTKGVNFPEMPSENILLVAVALLLGYISHLVYDSANREGIMWLHPYSKKRYHYLNIQTQSRGETLFAILNFFILIIMIGMMIPI